MNSSFGVCRVALLGRPNAGKSTLLNALLECPVSAVSPKPQTTRSTIRGVVQRYGPDQKWIGQHVLMDTPGVNFSKGFLDRSMFASIEESLLGSDLVIWVSDPKSLKEDLSSLRSGVSKDRELEFFVDQMKQVSKPWILAITKADMYAKNDFLPLMEAAAPLLPGLAAIVPVASLEGLRSDRSNLEALLKVMDSHWIQCESPHFPESVTADLDVEAIVRNLVREQLFVQLYQELPYQADCVVLRVKAPSGGHKKVEVDAQIVVARESLKRIVVGQGGSRIKQIGSEVRRRYMEVTDQDIVLRLVVKVVERLEIFVTERRYAL
jgi:GTP-binding protein Era